MSIPDVPFVLLFFLTTIVVVGLFGRGIWRLLQSREPAPPVNPEA